MGTLPLQSNGMLPPHLALGSTASASSSSLTPQNQPWHMPSLGSVYEVQPSPVPFSASLTGPVEVPPVPPLDDPPSPPLPALGLSLSSLLLSSPQPRLLPSASSA